MPEFVIDVKVDPRRAEAGARRVRKQLGDTDKAANRLRRSLTGLFAGFGLAAGVTKSIQILRDFSQEMSTVQAITGSAGAEFDRLSAQAENLGRTTRFSATQAAEGMSFLARAGFSATEVLESVDDTLLLAQAGALDLGRAADIASNVLTSFRLNTSQTGEVVDVLAKAANTSNTNVTQLGDALKFVAPVSAGLGISLQETTGAIGALSDAGLQATLAGTGLRRVLSELEAPSSMTKDILGALGVTADQVRVSQVGLTQALQVLGDAGINTADALAIFGQRGGPAFEVLVSNIPKVKELTEGLNDAGGTAKRVADIMDDNLNGAMLRVRSALEGLVIRLGKSGAEGAFRGLFEAIASGINRITDNLDNVIRLFNAFAFVIGVQLARIAIPAAITALNKLKIALLANPIGVLIFALTSAISLLISFRQQVSVTSTGFTTLGDIVTVVSGKISRSLEIVSGLFNSLLGTIRTFLTGVDTGFNVTFRDVVDLVVGTLATIVGAFIGLGRAIGAALAGLPRAIGDIFVRAFNAVLGFIESTVNKITNAISNLTEFAGLGRIGEVELAKLENRFVGGAKDLGNNVGEAFNSGLEDSIRIGEGAVDQIFFEAEGLAIQRAKKAEAEFQRLFGNFNPFSSREAVTQVPAEAAQQRAGSGFDPDAEKPAATLEEVLNQLERERELLSLSNREREIRNTLFQIEDDLGSKVFKQNEELLTGKVKELQLLADESELLDEIVGRESELITRQETLNRLFNDGKISAEQYNDELLNIQEALLSTDKTIAGGLQRGLIELNREFNDLSNLAKDTLVDGFKSAEDAIVNFVQTGKFEFNDLVNSIAADITRLAVRQGITQPLFNSLQNFGASAAGGSGGGIGALIGSFLGGFNNGADFVVGGRGGVDNNLVSMNLSRGERVQITPAGQSSSSTVQQQFIIQTPSPESFKRSEAQILARANRSAMTASQRNN